MEDKKVLIDDKAVPLSKTKVRVGFGQIINPTPALATKIFRIILYTVGVLNLISLTFTDIPPEVTEILKKYSTQTILFAHAASKMFGLSLEGK